MNKITEGLIVLTREEYLGAMTETLSTMNESISRAESLEQFWIAAYPWLLAVNFLLGVAIVVSRKTRLRRPILTISCAMIAFQLGLAGATHLQRKSADQDHYYEASFALTFGHPADQQEVCSYLAAEHEHLVSEIQEACRLVEKPDPADIGTWI
jgi:hypothetical protein